MHKLILQLLLAIAMVLSVYARHSGMPVWVFWPIYLATVIVTYFIVKDGKNYQKTLSISILVVAITAIQFAALPESYFLASDDVFEAEFSQSIVDKGVWDPTQGSGFADTYYGYSPTLHIITATVSTVTGMDAYWVVKYFLPVVFRLMMALMILLILKELDGKVAYLATFIFVGCAGFAFISITRRTMAGIFVLYAIYALLKSDKPKWTLLFFIFSALVVLSNRTISMYFMFFLAGAWGFSLVMRFFKVKVFKDIFFKLIVYVGIFIVMQLLTRHIFFHSDGSYVEKIYSIVSILSVDMLFSGAGGKGGIDIYHRWETLLIYASQALYLGLAGLAFLGYLFKFLKRTDHYKFFVLFFSLVGFAVYGVTPVLMVTEYDIAVMIILWLFCVPVSLFFAYFIGNMKGIWKPVALLLVLVIFSGSILMGIYTPRLINRMPNEDVVIGAADGRSKTLGLAKSAEWLHDRHPDSTVFGDEDVFETYSGFYRFDVNFYLNYLETIYLGDYPEVFKEKKDIEFGSYTHTLYKAPVDYIVINLAIPRNQHMMLGSVPFENINKIDVVYDKIYCNDDIYIYSGDSFA